MINARTLAYQILLHLDQKASYPDRLIRTMMERHSRLDERDRALLTELVYGVLRWQGRLDRHIDQLSKVKPQKIASPIRILLRTALYQILFLDRIPSHAAVNETVKIAKSTQPEHLVRFVNAILREALRRTGDWNRLSPEENPEEYLAVMTSHPRWLVSRYLKELGFDETERLCRANNDIAPMVLRVNSLLSEVLQVIGRLEEDGITAEPSPYLSDAVRVTGIRRDITQIPIYQNGWVQIQDEASQLISRLLSPQPGARVLDLCAGFGGKSTHMAAIMKNEGDILSVDMSAWKLEELKENAVRQGISIIRTEACNVLELDPDKSGKFDRVLLDAPCSGFGSLRRNPDIKWRRHPKDPYRFSRIQSDLLQHAAKFVSGGGILVYATCTMLSEENEEVAGKFEETHPQWSPESAADFLPDKCGSMTDGAYFKSWPHRHGIDGFFGARWRKL
ncbi:MAG: 16S rRNA (cytosine(967)-C(5))-methyltransferase RsmB [Syntrophobacteraceae bacterium]